MSGPDFLTHGGEGIGEGWLRLAIPGRGSDGALGMGAEPVAEQGGEGEQAQQAGRGAGDGAIRPLALGLEPEMIARLTALRQAQE